MRIVRAGVSVLLLVALAGSCSSDRRPDAASSSAASESSTAAAAAPALAAPSCDRPHAAGQTTETLDFEGTPRAYELYVPPSYDGESAVPVVFNFHGFGSTAKRQMSYGDFKPEADRDSFLIVALDGQGEGAAKHFNLLSEPGLQDDVAVTNALLDHLEATFCVDAKRIYSTGMSDGGAMTTALACRDSDRFAAFGAVAVMYFFPGCAVDRQVAFMGIMGTADPVVPFDGGPVRCCGGATLPPAPDSMASWADHNGCDPAFTDEQVDTEVTKRTWTGCEGGEVIFYIIVGGGHTWPGATEVARLGKTTTQLDASTTIWEFFRNHPLT